MERISFSLGWVEGKNTVRSAIIGGMQIEITERPEESRKYGFAHKWSYSLWRTDGTQVCWGFAHTKAEIKKFSAVALRNNLVRR